MDELILDDKKYLSSKKAAQVTGYAKDYVGQLCREGRVDARLVGRNWYVLESSILEHRFGEETTEEVPVEKPESPIAAWERATYTSEPVETVPVLVPKIEQEEPVPTVQPEERPKAIVDMQSAWQEWFEQQEKRLPDASPMLLEDHEAPSSEVESAAVPMSIDAEEPVVLHIERTAPAASILQQSVRVSQRSENRPNASVRPIRSAPEVRTISPRRLRGGNTVLKATFMAIAGVAIAVTVLGSGAIDPYVASNTSSPITNFFGGIILIDK